MHTERFFTTFRMTWWRDVQNDAYSVFAFNVVILSRAKDLGDSTALGDSTNVYSL